MYNFDKVITRKGTGSSKWNGMYEKNPNVADNVVPLSVADMEFEHPQELRDGLKEFCQNGIFGYTSPTDAYFNAVTNWFVRRHGWKIEKEWITLTPGVVNAFTTGILAVTEPGEGVIVMSPVYYPFFRAIENTGRKIVNCPLIYKDNTYTIDFDLFEKLAAESTSKAFLMSNPHNPVGRVYTKEELLKIADICYKNGLVVLSDEIHCDFIMSGYKHVPFGTLDHPAVETAVICTAPSKTFNLAGFQVSNIVIKDAALRDKYRAAGGYRNNLNCFAYQACRICYDKCEKWFDELLVYIEGNYNALKDYVEKNMKYAKVTKLEGTYLMWIDFTALGLSNEELEKIMINDAQAFLDEGYIFRDGGSGFERINLACPRSILLETIERMDKALAPYAK